MFYILGNKKNTEEPPKTMCKVKYPDNLHIKDVLYFTFVPTYCYNLNIKMENKFNWLDLVVQVGRLLCGVEAMLNINDHIIKPGLEELDECPGLFQFNSFSHLIHTAAKASILAVSIHHTILAFDKMCIIRKLC